MPNQTPLIILGSCRPESDTKSFVDFVFNDTDYKTVDLLTYQIAPYRYDGVYPSTDNFIQLVETILDHDILVFATPVYWYSMSGLMKTMLDRFTDLIRIHKPLGRKFKNKHLFLLSVGSNDQLPDGFCVPFISSADYLDMHYQGNIYYSTGEEITYEEKRQMCQTFMATIRKTQTVLTY